MNTTMFGRSGSGAATEGCAVARLPSKAVSATAATTLLRANRIRIEGVLRQDLEGLRHH